MSRMPKRQKSVIIILILIITIPGIFLLKWLYIYQGDYFVLILGILAAPVMALIFWLLILIVKQRKNKLERESGLVDDEGEQFVGFQTSAITAKKDDRLTREQEIEKRKEVTKKVNDLVLKDFIPDGKCHISKTNFKEGDEIAQCNNCFSLYKKNYLIDWLIKKETCPVCKKVMLS